MDSELDKTTSTGATKLRRQPLTVSCTISAVLQGTVLFSTMIAPGLAWIAISLVTASSAVTSVALPAPIPRILVGVLTAISTISASLIVFETSVVKNRFGTRACTAISSRCSPHRDSHSEVADEAEDMLAMDPDRCSSLENPQALDPSRAIRRTSKSPGS